ncbi:hypothetical protein POTOM_038287 [Populus tomentosa]|uniref:Uncharacterized protein n=1 Tax=Populus tomentosa TaxID=118781 RepID=A0A8X7YR15_POPTO|nr:hypothetical protein POTOM_038287 [Populus tomentosa]
MGKATSFKNEFTFDERLGESKNIIVKYPDRVPQVKWIQSMNLTRMMMDFCICATAARKHLAKLYLPCP